MSGNRKSHKERVLELARNRGILRPLDLDDIGVPRRYLSALRDEGLLEQPARGLYIPVDADVSENISLAQVSKLIPQGVVCLLSALAFHGLTTQLPFRVWIAVSPNQRKPAAGYLPVRVVHLSGPALEEGVERHTIDGVSVPIFGPAKTVADCFKHRNKVGKDVALEALNDCWTQGMCNMDDLVHFAEVDRVKNVMMPYFETLR